MHILIHRQIVCLRKYVSRQALVDSEMACFPTEAFQQRLLNRGFSTEASQQRLPNRGFSTEASQQRLTNRGFSKEASQQRLLNRGFSTEASQQRLPNRGFSTEASQQRLLNRGFSTRLTARLYGDLILPIAIYRRRLGSYDHRRRSLLRFLRRVACGPSEVLPGQTDTLSRSERASSNLNPSHMSSDTEQTRVVWARLPYAKRKHR